MAVVRHEEAAVHSLDTVSVLRGNSRRVMEKGSYAQGSTANVLACCTLSVTLKMAHSSPPCPPCNSPSFKETACDEADALCTGLAWLLGLSPAFQPYYFTSPDRISSLCTVINQLVHISTVNDQRFEWLVGCRMQTCICKTLHTKTLLCATFVPVLYPPSSSSSPPFSVFHPLSLWPLLCFLSFHNHAISTLSALPCLFPTSLLDHVLVDLIVNFTLP